MGRLILTINNQVLNTYHLAPGEQLAIGRHPDNQICIDSLSVSSHHAVVRLDHQRLVLTDLESRNGTMINNEPVTSECQLAHQDWITIGKHICIVDLYETLSLEATVNDLKAFSSARTDADQTMFLDREEVESGLLGFDYLSFLSADRDDFELNQRLVTIGKNEDAEIKISGLWSILAGAPSATISKLHDDYVLEHTGGMLTPKINGMAIKVPTKLNHQDIIKIGPMEAQIRCVRRPSK